MVLQRSAPDPWLRSSMSEGLLASVANYTPPSLFGSLSISEYVDKAQSISDALNVVGSPVSDQDIVLQLLNGLGPDYALTVVGSLVSDQDIVLQLLNGLGPEFDSVVSNITSSRSDEVQALLLSHVNHLEHHHTMTNLSVKMLANLAFSTGRTRGVRSFANHCSGPAKSS
uniref:Uncharacterized protein n=1 Tax=Cannabis sativa TaxID=3483 RepID=A0A803PHB1_CANSA